MGGPEESGTETGSTETGSTEAGSTETGSTETGSTETGSTETGSSHVGRTSLRVATLDVLSAECRQASPAHFTCELAIRSQHGVLQLSGGGEAREAAIAAALAPLCRRPFQIAEARRTQKKTGQWQYVVATREFDDRPDRQPAKRRVGVGRCSAEDPDMGLVVASLRAASHAAMLKSAYRANHQRALRGWSRDLLSELVDAWGLDEVDEFSRLEAEGIVLEHLNRVASAAVVTAANHPDPDSILSLFDNSAWLYDSHGARRDAYTATKLWLAWYPGIENDELTVDAVIKSMPAAPETAIPWIVKLFENPESWLRFRGAVDLEDHDVMHVLLGRGLQDQDEAFVIGFAMGTAKKISWLEYRIFKFVLAYLYPEPYRIPKFLQPAFDLGVKCGQETGAKDLYKRQLKELRGLTLCEARRQAGIDLDVVRKYYEIEQQQIPFTIASLRLP